MKFDEVEFFLTLAQCNMSNTVVTWPPSILKSGPTRFFDPLHIVFGLKLPNLRLPKVLDCLRKFPVYTWSKQFPGDALWKRCSENFSRFIDKHKKQSSGGVMLNFVNISGKFCKIYRKTSLLLPFKVAGWKPKTVRSSHWRCSAKNDVLRNFVSFTGKFFNKVGNFHIPEK